MTRATTGLGKMLRRKRTGQPAMSGLVDLPEASAPVTAVRRAHDFYPTVDTSAIRALLAADGEVIRAFGGVWEPACGDGAMVRPIRDAGIPCTASDLVDRGCPDSWQMDFFEARRSRAPAIITNPPYNLITARDGAGRWLRHSLALKEWSYMALLLSWDWPAGRINGFAELLEELPFSYAYLCRWKIDFTGQGQAPQRNAWFVWRRPWHEPPMTIRFLDRVDNRQSSLL